MTETEWAPAGSEPAAWSVRELEALVAEVGGHVMPLEDARSCLAQVEVLEALKSAVCAAQVRATEAYAVHETERLELLREEARGRGGRGVAPAPVVGSEVGLARRESPARGRTLVGAARALVCDLPETLAALSRGELNEERVLLVVRETAELSAEDRRAVDLALVAGPTDRVDDWGAVRSHGASGLGTEELRRMLQRLVLGIEGATAARRMARARARRHVSGRLLGDGTGRITAVVKSEHYGEVMAALGDAAAAARHEGDPRTADQVRADTLVQRVTGLDPVASRAVDLHLVMDLASLTGESDEPGWVPGSGYLPAEVCRDLFAESVGQVATTVRRLFTLPEDGQLVAMEQSGRSFTGLLAELIRLRDGGTCRTPWCDAPIRNIDHVLPDREGGATVFENGQGLCEACNQVKESPGWTSWVGWRGGGPEIGTITSAGRVRFSKPPPLRLKVPAQR